MSTRPIFVLACALLTLASSQVQARPERPTPGSRPAPGARPAPTGTKTEGLVQPSSERQKPDSAQVAAAKTKIQGKLPPLDAEQQGAVDALKGDLQTLGQGAQNAEGEIKALAQNLQSMAVEKPDPALIQDLATDLQSALADSNLSPQEAAALSADIMAVLNSAGLDQNEIETLKNDVAAVLEASGVDQQDIQAIVADLQAIYDAMAGSGAGSSTRTRPRARG